LIGKKTGDTATIETPVGSYDVKILKVKIEKRSGEAVRFTHSFFHFKLNWRRYEFKEEKK